MQTKTQKIYDQLFDLIDKNRDNLYFSDYEIDNFKERSKGHLFGIKLKEEFGFNVNSKSFTQDNYACLSSSYDDFNIYIRKHKKGDISCSDNKKQPDNELLLYIRFPTGAYIFGDYYPKELFNDFFEELKTFKPKYIDTVNKCLYFSTDNAGNFYNNFKKILDKYKKLNDENYKKVKAEKLRKELEELEK